ncbi:MAG: hypothetical protein FJ297_10150 [Planctomycetes bacterium]|nr:hypothetical protein [Planctomycetota bacterium]
MAGLTFRSPRAFVIGAVLASMTRLAIWGELRGDAPTDPATSRRTLGRPFACADYGGKRVCLVDTEGQVTWEYPADGPQDIWILKNGNVLFSHVGGATEVTRDRQVVWKYQTAEKNEVHACQPLPDGKVMVAESGPMRLIEVDREGRVTHEVKLTTATDRTHLQMRGARKLSDGHYLVGQFGDGVVREYDGSGKIVREFAQPMAFVGIRLSDGNTLIASGDAHRILEVDRNGRVVWEVTENELAGNPLRFIAGMQRLANGNTLVCNWGGHGHIGKQPQIFEITRDKKIVGEFFDYARLNTVSGVFVAEDGADPAAFQVQR